jgi:hypothetical protein
LLGKHPAITFGSVVHSMEIVMRSLIVTMLLVLSASFPVSAREQCAPSSKPTCMAAGQSSLIVDVARKRSRRSDPCGCMRKPRSERFECECLCAGGFWSQTFKVCF